jgi:hypothetical protein
VFNFQNDFGIGFIRHDLCILRRGPDSRRLDMGFLRHYLGILRHDPDNCR